MALNIHMEKAYDRIRWDFIRDSLVDAQLLTKLIGVIMQCVTSPSLQVLWNSGFTKKFKPSRGIRQGDPILPYLFVLKMEKLGHAIRRESVERTWKLIVLGRGGP